MGVLRSHGGRWQAIQDGEVHIDIAVIAAPTADAFGNADGSHGKSACGSLGFALADSTYADRVIVVTDNLVPFPCVPWQIQGNNVDYVVEVDSIGDPAKIVSGTTQITRSPDRLRIAEFVGRFLRDAGIMRDEFSFQAGAGGIALAFAAQKTIENVFGTVMIVVDRPVRVGDFCKVGDFMGTIEEIGLRSTRLRTMDRTLVVIPNGQLAATMVENYASRERFWFRHIIGLRHETTADQLRYVLEEIRAYLKAHSKVEPGTIRVRFIRFGGSSLDLEIFAYVLLADYSAFLGVQEELLLRIMDIIAEAGTSVAFPSQTTYLAKDSGLDAEKSQAAVERIRNQRNGVLAQ